MPHLKSNTDNLRETMKGDWKKVKMSKYSYPELAAEGDDDGVEEEEAGWKMELE